MTWAAGSWPTFHLGVWTSEPRVTEAVASGAGLVVFSGDKLLGGPQAGCLVGRQQLIAQCRRNPLARALRSDKLTLAALAATLALYQDPEAAIRTIPVLAMLTLAPAELARRAALLASLCPAAVRASTRPRRVCGWRRLVCRSHTTYNRRGDRCRPARR